MRSPLSTHQEFTGFKLHQLEWQGADPTLILLHGWLDQAWSFSWLADALPNRLLAWDARGHGHSDWVTAESFYHFQDYLWDLHLWLERVSPEQPVILLGHSMGGMIAAYYAGVFPERVKGLINLEGWIVPDSAPETVPDRLRLWIDQRLTGKPFRPLQDLDEAIARLQQQDSRLTDTQARLLAQQGTVTTQAGRLSWRHDPRHRMRAPQPFRLDQAQAIWKRINCPVLLAYGQDSDAQRLPDFEQRMSLFGLQPEISALPDAGHNLHAHQPQALADIISSWLNRHGLSELP